MWNPLKDWVGWLLIAALVVGVGWGYFHPRENWREAAMRESMREFMRQQNVDIPVYLPRLMPYFRLLNEMQSPDQFQRQFEKIPPAAGHLLAAYWCRAEVLSEGFEQFFANSTGVLAPEAVEGFRAMGLGDAADVLQQAMDLLPQPYPRDAAPRNQALARKLKKHSNRELFQQLDRRFEELLSSRDGTEADRFETAANRYARENLGGD